MTPPDRWRRAVDRALVPLDRVLGVPKGARLAALGVVAGVAVWLIATLVFPHHSTNHDEGVYLQQAAMLLEGQLFLDPPVDVAFRPWFFVESEAGLSPKYTPPTAAVFALGKVLGGYRLALALVAAGVAVLAQVTVAEAFDDRTGWVAAGLLLASPLYLVQASVFLPYVPALLWSLAFAAAYLRADRTGSRRLATVAGLAIGVGFFARPFTAVLFAAPFVGHAIWTLRTPTTETLEGHLLTAVGGFLGVSVTLAYNAYVTGDPLLFPYEAFAPLDGLGFGRRELLGYAREYTPELAARATVESLWLFGTRWFVAGAVGTGAAIGGFAVALRRGLDARQATIAAIAPSVTVGYAYFWGPLNALGALGRGGDGLAAVLGPYYHVPLLVPAATFAAIGLLAGLRWGRETVATRFGGRHARRLALVGLLVLGSVLAGAGVVAVAVPLADNASASAQLDAAYEPFERTDYDDAVVFLPTPHGDWLNHPFQTLRNDPGYEDGPIYALRERQFDVIEAFPDRTYYRYTYRGVWSLRTGDPVEPRVQRVTVSEGARVHHAFALGVPAHADRVSVRVASGDAGGDVTVPVGGRDRVEPSIAVADGTATLAIDGQTASVPVEGDTVELRAFVDYGTGAGYEYRVALPVETEDDTIRTLTPYAEVCTDAFTCGGAAAYVPGAHADHVAVDHEVTAD